MDPLYGRDHLRYCSHRHVFQIYVEILFLCNNLPVCISTFLSTMLQRLIVGMICQDLKGNQNVRNRN
jgi:hypothetical protein